MAGHSHWAGIKHKKEVTDKKRAAKFSKLLKAIGAAARDEPNPDFNPRLRTAVEKAKGVQVPKDAIERAIEKAASAAESLEELLFGGYGPGNAAVLIEILTDNRNRAVQEIKQVLSEHGGKWAEVSSVEWAFELKEGTMERIPKFPQQIEEGDKGKLSELIQSLYENDDVQEVYTNAEGDFKENNDTV